MDTNLFGNLQMSVGILQSQLVVSESSVGIAQTPAGPTLAHAVKELLGNQEVTLVVLDGGLEVPHQRVGVAQAVAGLRFQCSVPKLLGNLKTFPGRM